MAKLRAINDVILGINGEFGDHVTEAGIIVKSTSGKNEGITPRWFEILDVGPEIDWVQPGQWVYVEYGRWSEALTLKDDRLPEGKGDIWRIDSKGCMLVSDERPDNQFNYNTDTAFAGPDSIK